MCKAVLLDIDNTILSFDDCVRQFMKEGFAEHGLRIYEDWMFGVFGRINAELWQEIEQGRLTLPQLEQVRWNRIFDELDIDFDGVTFEEEFKSALFESAIVIDGAQELLDYLHKHYILCAASNGPYDQQVNRLKNAHMLDYFDHLFISEEIGFSKPSEKFFQVCMQRLSIREAKEILVLGDSLSSDILGGVQMGMKTCFYNPNGKPVPQELKVDRVIQSLKEFIPNVQ